jgi:hypothetical protein
MDREPGSGIRGWALGAPRKTEDRKQKVEERRQTARRQKTEDRRQKTDDRSSDGGRLGSVGKLSPKPDA